MKNSTCRFLVLLRSESGGANASVFLFAGIVTEIVLLADVLCVMFATDGLQYSPDPLGTGCITGAGCIVLIVLCGVLLRRSEQMMYFIVSAVITAVAAAAMLIFRAELLIFCRQILASLEMLNTDFTSVAEIR